MKERIKVAIALTAAVALGIALYHYYLQLSKQTMLSELFIHFSNNALASYRGNHTEYELPNLLIIGDSISKGYLSPLEITLKGKINVLHIGDNARDTQYTLDNLRRWLEAGPRPDMIVFNNGLHDIKYVDRNGLLVDSWKGRPNISIDSYRKNMEQIVNILKETKAELFFATTTPVPEFAIGYVPGSEIAYNQTAMEIMKRQGVLICDLYSLATPLLSMIQNESDIHFNSIGRWIFAEGIAAVVLSRV